MDIHICNETHIVYGIEGDVNFRGIGVIDSEGGVIVYVCHLRRDAWSFEGGCL